ncbi:hypothetical protein LSAT2_010207, partial [Lamellibrachia satsuma]
RASDVGANVSKNLRDNVSHKSSSMWSVHVMMWSVHGDQHFIALISRVIFHRCSITGHTELYCYTDHPGPS